MLKISQWTTAAVSALTDSRVDPRAARAAAEVATAPFRISSGRRTPHDAAAAAADTAGPVSSTGQSGRG